jgi:hypothetical protein
MKGGAVVADKTKAQARQPRAHSSGQIPKTEGQNAHRFLPAAGRQKPKTKGWGTRESSRGSICAPPACTDEQRCSGCYALAGSRYGLPSVCPLCSEITILHAVVEISGHDVTTTQARHAIWARMTLRDNVKDAVTVARIAMPRETCTRSGNRGSCHESSFLFFSFTSRRRASKL